MQPYRPIILGLTALAAGCTIYYLHESVWSTSSSQHAAGALHRSNAQRHRRRRPVHRPDPAEQPETGIQEVQESQNRDLAQGESSATLQALEGETATDAESEHSWLGEEGAGDGNKEGQSLLNLLYRIAEEQARKEGYAHRGVTCNSCNEQPIRGIRYRCANCVDYDLCEQCEALQIHARTHVFYKVRVPAPYLNSPRQPQAVFYPGKPLLATHNLPRDTVNQFSRSTGYQTQQIEALWEQFRCMAATDFPEDPGHYHLAIDRRTFDKCFVPNASSRPPPPNFIYDRIFGFYDTNSDGLIGFEEFLKGLACLQKDKADERLRRVFRGYDVNGDGLVDRKDFLRMFRAYYALSKELVWPALAGQEMDGNEDDARDLVLGGQPISSMFSGIIPLGGPSRAGHGKTLDEFGDAVIVDNVEAVENHDIDLVANPDDMVADSAEATHFGTPIGKYSHEPAGKELCKLAYDGPWPPAQISPLDIEKALKRSLSPKGIEDKNDQAAVRRCTHGRLAKIHQHRQYIRRRAMKARAQRRSFYSENVDAAGGLGDSEAYSAIRQHLERISASDMVDRFRASCVELIDPLGWPIDSKEDFVELLQSLGRQGWTEAAIAQDISGYAPKFSDVRNFVHSFCELARVTSGELIQEMGPEQPFESLPSSRRSRSSSKVRFEDGLGTEDEHESRSVTSVSSRSIPISERWGGLEFPEPEQDVGRETLYQATQEAFNELLDPVFKVREDLALEALQTRPRRALYRANIIAAAKSPRDIKLSLDMYQRKWRKERSPSAKLGMDEEISRFLQFMRETEAGVQSTLTGEDCAQCDRTGHRNFIALGSYCTACGQMSAGLSPSDEQSKEPCPRCTQDGRDQSIGHGKYCNECGQPATGLEEHEAILRSVISNGYQGQPPRLRSRDEEEGISGDNRLSPKLGSVAEAEDVPKATGQKDSADPREIAGAEVLPKITDLDSQTLLAAEEISYPAAALDLHSAVTAFNEADLSIEDQIAQKPLEDLLADSGYAVASSPPPPPAENIAQPSCTPTTPPDPTLPQNRPNSLPLPDQTRPRPKAPQQQHDKEQYTTKPEDIPDIATLKYFAALDMHEAEDRARGGPGRMKFGDFEEVMKGEKGEKLGFLTQWVEMASF